MASMSTTGMATATEVQTSTTKDTPSSQGIDIGATADLISMDSLTPESKDFLISLTEMNYQRCSSNDMRDRSSGLQALHSQTYQPPYSGSPSPTSVRQALTSSYKQSNGPGTEMPGGEVPLSSIKPGLVYPTEAQWKVARTYGVRRENGTYVPLIPADELSSLDQTNLFWESGPENMIILPPLRLPRADNRESLRGNEHIVPPAAVNSLPLIDVNRHNGVHIDRLNTDDTQTQIDSIVAASSNPAPTSLRRQKVYCDKWIHDGTCAFTQLGCKYKHEMPLDKATQMSLGLNHGTPKWYKLKHQDIFRRRDSLSSGSTLTNSPIPTTPRKQASWRHGDPMTPIQPTKATSGPNLAHAAHGPSTFGPIAPPITGSSHSRHNPFLWNNPFDALSSIEYESEEEGEMPIHARH